MFVRIVDVHHLPHQPAAVSRGVGQEIRVVARATERSDVLAMLLVAGVCRPFADVLGSHHRLQLVEVGVLQFVDFFQANQGKFAQGEHIILREMLMVHLDMEIHLKDRRQQERKERTLEVPLFADEYQNLVVHGTVVQQGRHDAHEPFAEMRHKEFGIALHMHGPCQLADVVHPVPFRQRTEVILKRMIQRHEFGLKHVADVL